MISIWQSESKGIKLLFFSFILLQILLLVGFGLSRQLPLKSTTFLGLGMKEIVEWPLVWSRANFDGFYYAKIAQEGYSYLQQAFFPIYPLLIRWLKPIFGSYIISGLVISNLSFVGLLLTLWKILNQEKFSRPVINFTILSLILFPTSFYFVSVYTESFFLWLVFLSFYFARKRQWLWAGLMGVLASGTRVVGIFLLPALLVEYYQQNKNKMTDRYILNHFKNLTFVSLSSLGLLGYMFYLKCTTGDWLYFAHVQSQFGANRLTGRLVLLPQVFWRYLKMIFTVDPQQWLYFIVWLEFIIALLFLILLSWGWFKRKEYQIRDSWLVFASLAYILPTLTGTFSSMPRYVLVCFPCFIVLAKAITNLKKRFSLIKGVYLIFSLILLVICTAFFFRGYWIA